MFRPLAMKLNKKHDDTLSEADATLSMGIKSQNIPFLLHTMHVNAVIKGRRQAKNE